MALEIERKYLIAPLDDASPVLASGTATAITQVYLACAVGEERVRARTGTDGVTTWTHTTKQPVAAGIDEENEREITETEYDGLLTRAEPSCVPVVKTRWAVPHGELTLEIDRIEQPEQMWILEVELPDADLLTVDLHLPGGVVVIADVTGDRRFKNRQLAART